MSSNTRTESTNPAFDSLTEKCLTTPFTEWHPNVMAVFADRIEDAFYEKLKGPLAGLESELEALMNHVMASAPDGVHQAIVQDAGDERIRAAYMLGRLSFAQQFTGSVASRRPDDEFYEEFNHEHTKKIIACLATSDHTKPELFKATGMAQASLDFKMKKLLQLGITDFRTRYGNGEPAVAEYFLTSAAKQMLQANKPD